MSDLARIIAGAPSRGAWLRLLRLLDPWPASITEDEVTRALEAWPSELREATPGGWQAARGGDPPPWWPLVRRVQLTPADDPDDEVLAALAGVTQLALDASGVAWLTDGLPQLPWLEALELFALEDFESFAALPVLPALHTVLARGCPHLRDLSGLDAQPALRLLDVSRSAKHLAFETLPALPALRVLHVDETAIADLAPLAGLASLERLKLAGCTRVTDLTPLGGCTALAWLDASRIPGITDVAPLGGLARLATLWIDGEGIARLASLRGLPIAELIVGHAATVDAASIAALPALDRLHLVEITDVPLRALAASPVTQLFVLRCAHLDEVGAFARLAQVRRLVVEDLPELRDLAAIGAMPALIELQINACPALADVSGLAAAHALELVALRSCPAVSDVSALAALQSLRRIDLSGTPVTRGLEGLDPRIGRS